MDVKVSVNNHGPKEVIKCFLNGKSYFLLHLWVFQLLTTQQAGAEGHCDSRCADVYLLGVLDASFFVFY